MHLCSVFPNIYDVIRDRGAGGPGGIYPPPRISFAILTKIFNFDFKNSSAGLVSLDNHRLFKYVKLFLVHNYVD